VWLGLVGDGTNLGDGDAALLDNEGLARHDLADDFAGLKMKFADSRKLHVSHRNTFFLSAEWVAVEHLMEPVFLSLDEVLEIHEQQIERYGGSARDSATATDWNRL
jgi:hypothetical protein